MTSLKLSLLKCHVLSLKDACLLYPFCQLCVSRLQREETQQRYRCPKCGWTCEIQNVTYRYRLSLNVTRDCDIFGVTVFGSCLDPYFGVSAGGLQSFVEEFKKRGEGSQIQQLLIKAVEESFVGRCLVFGVKMSGFDTDGSNYSSDGYPTSLKRRKISGQFVANQIIMPNSAIISCPVVIHFKNLLRAAWWEFTDISVVEQHWGSLPLLNCNKSPVLQRSECTLFSHKNLLWNHERGTNHTPEHCQLSYGPITLSAVQEHSHAECRGSPLTDPRQQREKQLPDKIYGSETSSYLMTRFCSSDMRGRCVLHETVDVSSCSAFYASGEETVDHMPQTYFQSKLSLLKNAFESSCYSSSSSPTSVVRCEKYHSLSTMNNSEIPCLNSDQSEDLCLRKKALCGALSPSNSAPWEDLPFSESLGELVYNVHRCSEAVPENIHSSAGKKDATPPNMSYIYDLQGNVPIQKERLYTSSEHSRNSTKLALCCPNGGQLQEGTLMLLTVDLPDICNNGDSSCAIVPNTQEHKIREARVDRINLFSHFYSPRAQTRRQDELPLSGFSVLSVPTGQQLLALNGHDSAICDWLIKREAMNPQRRLSWREDVNTSADLFDDCEGGISAVSERSKAVTEVSSRPQTCVPEALNTDGTPRSNAQGTDYSCNVCVSELDLSNCQEFVPFCQSTPVSKKLPLKLYHMGYNMRDKGKKRLFGTSESELQEVLSPSINKTVGASVQKKLTGGFRRGVYGRSNSYRTVSLGSRVREAFGSDPTQKTADGKELNTTPNNTKAISTQSHFSSTQKRNEWLCNAVISSPRPEHNVTACDLSADLFTD